MNELNYTFLFRIKKYGKWQKEYLKTNTSSASLMEDIKSYISNKYCSKNSNCKIEVRDIEKM